MHAPFSLGFIQGIGGPELLVIFLVILLFFGARRLPELARGLGKSMKEFKKATSEVQEDFRDAMDAADPSKPLPPQAKASEATPKASPTPTESKS